MRWATVMLELVVVLVAAPAWADFEVGAEAHERGDYATALKEFRALAEQGDAGVQFILGSMYENGEGVPQDDAQAIRWYRRAAAQGLAPAQSILGSMYENGEGVPKDYVQAYMWLSLAAAQGYEPARKARVKKLAKKMTLAQLDEAQWLAREWKPKSK